MVKLKDQGTLWVDGKAYPVQVSLPTVEEIALPPHVVRDFTGVFNVLRKWGFDNATCAAIVASAFHEYPHGFQAVPQGRHATFPGRPDSWGTEWGRYENGRRGDFLRSVAHVDSSPDRKQNNVGALSSNTLERTAMTTEVKIQVAKGQAKAVAVLADDQGEGAGTVRLAVLKPGQSATYEVHAGRSLRVEETEIPTDGTA